MENIYEPAFSEAIDYGVVKIWTKPLADKIHLMAFLPRAKKPFKNLYFENEKNAFEFIAKLKKALFERQKDKDLWKKMIDEKRKEQRDATNIGDVFVNIWGWEQTNVDFYQVVKKTAKKLYFRAIHKEMTEATHWAGGKFIPKQNNFSDEKVITSCKYGSFSKWDGAPKNETWYA